MSDDKPTIYPRELAPFSETHRHAWNPGATQHPRARYRKTAMDRLPPAERARLRRGS